jgi:hypothetical protein
MFVRRVDDVVCVHRLIPRLTSPTPPVHQTDGSAWNDPVGGDGSVLSLSIADGSLKRAVAYDLTNGEGSAATDPAYWRLEGFDGRGWCVLHRVSGYVFAGRRCVRGRGGGGRRGSGRAWGWVCVLYRKCGVLSYPSAA